MTNADKHVCQFCQKPATCHGTYEGNTGYACDDFCGHGCEDGHCEFIDPNHDPNACKPTHLPKGAFYSCSVDSCAERSSFPPYMLWWCPVNKNWYCEHCVEHLELECKLTLEDWLNSNDNDDITASRPTATQ